MWGAKTKGPSKLGPRRVRGTVGRPSGSVQVAADELVDRAGGVADLTIEDAHVARADDERERRGAVVVVGLEDEVAVEA